jgi:hypothetical protein
MRTRDQAAVIERLAALRRSPDCIAYFEGVPSGDGRDLRVSIFGSSSTREVFVELTDGHTTRAWHFPTRWKGEIRAGELPLVDMCDAFALARQMARRWPKEAKSR